jgi:aerobic-type carbon monoxide dehydrogenase small subunit (CoxS/CutS family)
MTAPLSPRVNGDLHTVEENPDTPLLYVLRRTLGQSGARFGRGDGLCGACTVIVDGKAALSCDVPVGAVAD